MHYFIDGYNFLFQSIYAKEEEELKVQRGAFISELAQKIAGAKIQATLIFDAHFKLGSGERQVLSQLDIHFTNEGETADEYILWALHREKPIKAQTVVTDDQRLAWASRSEGAQSLSIKEFSKLLNRIYSKKLKNIPKMQKPEIPLPKKPKTLDERYLSLFEEKLVTEKPLAPSKKLPPREKEEKPFESDQDRWERAFNRNPDQDT